MRSRRSYWMLGIVTALLLLIAFVYLRDSRLLEEMKTENVRMSQRIEESALKQKDAIIQKRISEQLEEIAQQQKVITESQKTIALEQRALAEQKQREALVQKRVADGAKTRAVNALNDAEKQRKIAVAQKNAAEAAERNANRLRMIALGQSLSARSINQMNTGSDTLATMLALAAWQFISENNGDLYQSELFQALKMSSAEENTLRAHKGFIRDIDVMPGSSEEDLSLISVSQSGEIILWKGSASSMKPRMLFDDAKRDFRNIDFNADGSVFVASTFSGDLAIAKSPFNAADISISSLSDERISSIAFISNNVLVYPEGSNLIGLDVGSRGSSVQQVYSHTAEITGLLYNGASGRIFFSDVNGAVLSFDPSNGGEATAHFRLPEGEVSCMAIGENGKIAAGTASGKIFVQDGENQAGLKELIGHLSQVNDLAFSGDMLTSISYDRTVRLWNLKMASVESIVIDEHDDWGYNIDIVPGAEKLISAGADKFIRITTIDPVRLAELVKARVSRDFTTEEWGAYIGPTVEYKSLKQ